MIQDVAPLPGYPAETDLLSAILQDTTREWRGELWGVDPGPDAMTWRADPGGPSMGAISLHMVAVELFWLEQVGLGDSLSLEDKSRLMWEQTDVDAGHWPDPPAQPMSWYLDMHDGYRARTLEALKKWGPPEELRQHHGRQVSLRWILGHVIQHEAYHGGQIVLLYAQYQKRAAP